MNHYYSRTGRSKHRHRSVVHSVSQQTKVRTRRIKVQDPRHGEVDQNEPAQGLEGVRTLQQQAFQQPVLPQASHRRGPHGLQAVQVSHLPQKVPFEGDSKDPRSPAQKPQAVRVPAVREGVRLQEPSQEAFGGDARWRGDFVLQGLLQSLLSA